MSINIAVAPLVSEPPDWLRKGIVAEDALIIKSASNPRRKRELFWSRALKASLVEQTPEMATNNYPGRVSIAHDRHFAAVAISSSGNIGMDLQADYPLKSCYRIAETWFPDLESKEILASDNCDRFLLSWVIKEAWAKCMNRSILECCRIVAVWQGRVHITDGRNGIAQFAWSRPYSNFNEQQKRALYLARPGVTDPKAPGIGFTIGICLKGKAQNAPDIECFSPGFNAKLRHFVADWEWIPVAG